jgi:hypothetical protein
MAPSAEHRQRFILDRASTALIPVPHGVFIHNNQAGGKIRAMAVMVNGGPIAVPTSVTNGAAVDTRAMEAKTISIEGTFTANYQAQISCDPSDSPASTSWTNVGTALTAAGNIFIQQPCTYVRIQCTAYTSGTPVGRIVGMMQFD